MFKQYAYNDQPAFRKLLFLEKGGIAQSCTPSVIPDGGFLVILLFNQLPAIILAMRNIKPLGFFCQLFACIHDLKKRSIFKIEEPGIASLNYWRIFNRWGVMNFEPIIFRKFPTAPFQKSCYECVKRCTALNKFTRGAPLYAQ